MRTAIYVFAGAWAALLAIAAYLDIHRMKRDRYDQEATDHSYRAVDRRDCRHVGRRRRVHMGSPLTITADPSGTRPGRGLEGLDPDTQLVIRAFLGDED